jgi:hypothetical protein
VPAAAAFGLDIASDTPLPFLEGSASSGSGRPLEISYGSELPPWPADARLICDERYRDGAVSFQIEAAPCGYRIHGPAYGDSVLAGDGSSVRGAPGEEGFEGWQRLLVAQVLPFAAVLQGLEVLHAGAVVVEGGAVAISGPSGAGKTSLALALVRQGARLLADDVVAIERAGEELLAHPGAPITGIDREEAARLLAVGAGEAGSLLAENGRERVARAEVAERPVPLRALFLLERRGEAQGAPRFEPADDPRQLLGSTFNLLLGSSERLAGLLDVCAQIARQRVERIRFGPDTDPDELAAALWARLAR